MEGHHRTPAARRRVRKSRSTAEHPRMELSGDTYFGGDSAATRVGSELYQPVIDEDDDDESGDEFQENLTLAEAATRIEGDLAYDERSDDVLARIRSKDNGHYAYEPDRPVLSRAYEVLVPRTITEQYAQMKYASFMGLFPEINRAWITVDNRLFLWNYHDGSVYAYTDLSQVIITAAIIRPSPGVFLDRIQFALVLATPVEILMLGVEFTGSSIYGEMRLWPTHFRVPSDNVHMLKIIGTEHGRVFMAGKDGCLYEFVYQQPLATSGPAGPAGWLRKPLSWIGGAVGSSMLALAGSENPADARGGTSSVSTRPPSAPPGSEAPVVPLTAASKARKVNHSQSQLARLFPDFLFGAPRDPLVNLVLDESRSPPLLYTLSKDRCALQQWSLGPRPDSSDPQQVNTTALPGAPLEFMYQNQSILDGVRELGMSNNASSAASSWFGSPGQSQSARRAQMSSSKEHMGDDWTPQTFRLVDLSAIPASESERRLLVGVTSHGHRIFFGPKLKVKSVRKCPPYVDSWAAARSNAPSQAAAVLAASMHYRGSGRRGRSIMTPGRGSPGDGGEDAGPTGGLVLRSPEFRPGTSPRLVRKAFVAGDVILLADERDRDLGQCLVSMIRQPRQRSLVSATASTGISAPPPASAMRTTGSVRRWPGSSRLAADPTRRLLEETVELLTLHPASAGSAINRVADIKEVEPNFYLSLLASCLYKRGESEPLVGLSECATQHALARRQFLVLTTTGLLIFVKQRPVDELREALGQWRRTGNPAAVEALFQQYGAREACAMCLVVACGPPGQYDDGLSSPLLEAALLDEQELDELEDDDDHQHDPELLQRLRSLRQRRRLVSRLPDEELIRYATQAYFLYGDPAHRRAARGLDTEADPDDPDWQPVDSDDDGYGSNYSASPRIAASSNSGSPADELTGLDSEGISGKHSGLSLYLSRLLRSVWDWTVTVAPPRDRLAPEERRELDRLEESWLQQRQRLAQVPVVPTSIDAGSSMDDEDGDDSHSGDHFKADGLERRRQGSELSAGKRGRSVEEASAAGPVAGSIQRSVPPVYQRLRFSREQILELQAPLLRLLEFVRQNVEQLELNGDSGGAENLALLKLLSVSVEAFHLLEVMSRVHNFPRLVARLPEAQQAELRTTKFYRLATEEGRNLARSLLAVIMEADPEHRRWTAELYQKCRWFFGRADLLHHSAGKQLQSALQLIQTPRGQHESRRLLDEALRQFKRSSESSRFTRLESVCLELRRAGLYAGVVDLCLHRAAKLASGEIAPPASLAMVATSGSSSTPGQLGRNGRDRGALQQQKQTAREWVQNQIDRCHECIFDTLGYLTLEQQPASINDFQLASAMGPDPQLSPSQREAQRQLVLQESLKSLDEAFHYKLYEWLIRNDRQQQDLMNLRSPFVIGFLRSRLSRANIEILKDYLIHHRLFAEAAKLLANQARLVSPQLTYSLQERQSMLNQACMYARQWSEQAAAISATGDGSRDPSGTAQVRQDLGLPPLGSLSADDLADLEDRKLVCQLQVQVREQLLAARVFLSDGRHHGLGDTLARVDTDLELLDNRLLDIQQLWQLARAHRLWESCLAVLSVAQAPQDDRNVALHLWSSIIESEMQRAEELGQRDWSNVVTLKLRQLVQRHREQLGGVVFPLRALIMMLETINFNDQDRPSARGYPPLALLNAGVNSLVLLDHYDQLTEPNGYASTRPLAERVYIWWSVRALLLAHNQPLLAQNNRYTGPGSGGGHFQGLNLFNKCVVAINRLPKNPEIQELVAAFEDLRRSFRLP